MNMTSQIEPNQLMTGFATNRLRKKEIEIKNMMTK